MKGSGVCCDSHLMPLLNLPVGLLSSARFAPTKPSADLLDVRDEMRLPSEGLLSRGSAPLSGAVCARSEEALERRASTPRPVKLPEERRKGLELMKRGWLDDEEERSGLGGCASSPSAVDCAAAILQCQPRSRTSCY